ncbi:MAG: HD domain-containing protein [Candidatus Zixiibacteriota bacterium]|nr:MAG: HD domain-containing protein [candidate division Zixibacteria bacterium]
MIKDFGLKDTVTAFMTVRRREVKEYNNTTYIALEFGDASGRIAGVWWEPDRFAIEELAEGDVVKVKGVVGEYRGKRQLRVDKMRPAKPDEYQLSDLLAHSRYSVRQLKDKVLAFTEKVENSYISSLLQSFWEDQPFFESYLKAAAGKLWHHAFVGGLAEHSINVTELCLDMCRHYSFLSRDLLTFGGLFHDMGKIGQYHISSFIDYADEGRLIGHISLADSLIAEHAAHISDFPPALLMKLRHLILSHHGQIEYASPVVPQIPEAFILYYADEIDSKMGAIERIHEKTGSGWSEYVKLLDRMLYFDEEGK